MKTKLAATAASVALLLVPVLGASSPVYAGVMSAPGAPVIATASKAVQSKAKANLNLRKGGGTNHKILTTLKKGTSVTRTGKTQGSWIQIKATGKTGWVSSKYLTAAAKPKLPTATTSSKPKPKPTASSVAVKTTANLNLRKGAGTSHKIVLTLKKGTTVSKTGQNRGTWSQVKSGKHTGWVSSSFLTNASKQSTPQAKPTPAASKDRWTIRTQPTYSTPSLTSKRLKALSGASKVQLLKTSGKWSQVRTTSGTGWILSNQLVNTQNQAKKQVQAPQQNVKSWTSNTKNVSKNIMDRYGKSVQTIYGARAGSVGHSSGLAADVMIKNYKSAAAIRTGDQMANYLTANHQALKIDYIIWRDKIWLVEDKQWGPYSKGGWGKHLESTRGWNDTTLHMDHLHVETFPQK